MHTENKWDRVGCLICIPGEASMKHRQAHKQLPSKDAGHAGSQQEADVLQHSLGMTEGIRQNGRVGQAPEVWLGSRILL